MAGTVKDRAGAHAAPPSSLPWSEPELSRLILAGTGVVASLVVLLWLIVAPLVRERRQPNLLEITLAHPEGIPGDKPSTKDEIVTKLTTFFDRRNAGPAVVVLHGVVASRAADAVGEQGAYFLTPGGSRASLPTWIPLVDILKPFTTRGERAPTLLILDCEVKAGDRGLGIFGNGFVRVLKRLLDESRNKSDKLAVLAACDDVQSTWSMEGADGSVFDHFLKEALDATLDSPGPFSVNELHGRVRARVARWVDSHRSGAVQTPLLIAASDMRIQLVRPGGSGASTRLGVRGHSPQDEQVSREQEPAPEDELFKALLKEWGERQRLSNDTPPPYRHAPVKWRLYQDALLRAERRLRSGDLGSASAILNEARDYRNEVEKERTGPTIAPAWSLAILRKTAGSQTGTAAEEAVKYLDAINRLLPFEYGPIGIPDPAGAGGGSAAKADPAKDSKPGDRGPAPITPPVAPGGDLIAILAEHGNPRYVEGQLPVWYHDFERKGGEIRELRPERLERLRRAVDIRKKAEVVVALDPRIIPWIRSPLDEADKARRTGQDYLFGGDQESFKKCDEMLTRAQTIYEKVESEARPWSRAFDLLAKVQDALPYYGAAAAFRGESVPLPDQVYEHTASLAATKADLVREDPVPEPEIEERSKKLVAAADGLEKRYWKRLEDDFQKSLQDSEAAEWRQIDALLHVPSILPEKRARLLDRVRKLSPAVDGQDGIASVEPASGSNSDPAFARLARGLASIEQGLLRIGGRDVPELGELIDIGFSDRVRQLRDQSVARASAPGSPDGTFHDRALAEADRFARVATGLDLLRLTATDDPARGLDVGDTQRFLRWNGERLLDDFDIAAARRLLSGPGAFRPEDRYTIEQNARVLEASNLEINADPQNAGLTRTTVTLTGSPNFPRGGQAVVFIAHDRAVSVTERPRMADPAKRESMAFTLRNLGGNPAKLTPTAFFRGRFYQGGEIPLSVSDLVKVEIHQRELGDKKFKIRDQFANQQSEGYFHKGENLYYRLDILNQSGQKLKACIGREFGDSKPSDNLELEPHTAKPSTVNGIIDDSLFADGKPRILTVTVKENDEKGLPLSRPLRVEFKCIDPRRFVKVFAKWDAPNFYFRIVHLEKDPAPAPVEIAFSPTPINCFSQSNNIRDVYLLRRGEPITLEYEMTNVVEKFNIAMTVNSLKMASDPVPVREKNQDELEVGEGAKKPNPPPPASE